MTLPLHAQTRFTLTTPDAAFVTKDISIAKNADAKAAAVAVNLQRRLQVMEGFGACFNELGWTALNTLPAAQRDEVLKELFSAAGCNFSICRLPIGANDYSLSWYSHDEKSGDFALANFSISRDEVFLIPYIRAAMVHQRKLSLWASAWSPPTWMKTNGRYNGGTIRPEKRVLEAYADYLARFVKAYRERGLNLRSIHVQNEPGAEQPFPSCVWSSGQVAEFIGRFLGPKFAKEKTGADIWLGALNIGDAAYSERVLEDPAAAPFIAGAGFQWDGRRAIGEIHKKFPKLPLMETESECGDGSNDWKAAQHTWGLFRAYIGNGAGHDLGPARRPSGALQSRVLFDEAPFALRSAEGGVHGIDRPLEGRSRLSKSRRQRGGAGGEFHRSQSHSAHSGRRNLRFARTSISVDRHPGDSEEITGHRPSFHPGRMVNPRPVFASIISVKAQRPQFF
jgi:glucosylceramidase